jgi:hypothetical protein
MWLSFRGLKPTATIGGRYATNSGQNLRRPKKLDIIHGEKFEMTFTALPSKG